MIGIAVAVAIAVNKPARSSRRADPGVEARLDEGCECRTVWLEVHPIDINGAVVPLASRGMALDITARKNTERELAEILEHTQRMRERLDSLLASVPGAVWESYFGEGAADAPAFFVNDYVETLTGYSHKEWRANPDLWLSAVHPDDRTRVLKETDELVARGDGAHQFRCVTKGGQEIWVEGHQRTILALFDSRSLTPPGSRGRARSPERDPAGVIGPGSNPPSTTPLGCPARVGSGLS